MSALNDTSQPFRSVKSNGNASTSFDRHFSTAPNKPNSTRHLPERYTIKDNDDERVLICLEAPNLNVHIESGLSVSGSIAHKSPVGTIFLDGVAQCEPFMDHERQVYNFDHHEGCVRAFTLASCEQTLVMYMKGLDLQGREWNIFANEPDLDTILAIWILLNHTRIGRMHTNQRRILFALVRYEGVIDALGLELKELSALPGELMHKIQRVIDHLRSEEIRLKKEGRWPETDFLNYSAMILHKIDQIFYKSSDFVDYKGVEELARIDLNDQRIAAVVEADMGIYEIEPHLNKLYGNRLGVVFLKKGHYAYTVRQTDLFMPITLDDIYERLNFIDPAVKNRTKTNKWGGANDIGGSPRETGTLLKPMDIAQGCRDAVQKLKISQQGARFLTTTALTVFIVMIASIVRLYWNPGRWLEPEALNAFWVNPDFGFCLTLWLAGGVSLLSVARQEPWQYGWIRSSGAKWWWLLPLALVMTAAEGIWVPQRLVWNQPDLQLLILYAVCFPVAAELLFRSLAHGLWSQTYRIQRDDSPWFVSLPALFSALLYGGFILMLRLTSDTVTAHQNPMQLSIAVTAAAVFGITMAMVRERSQSLWPPILFHIICAAVGLALPTFL
jgi:membrane protease YdiL (CAAX protease family)